MNTAYISLGSNRGKRKENLERSIAQLNEKAGEVALCSSLYETEPWKMDNANSFLNQVVELKTTLPAEKLMEILLGIEAFLGRVRREGKYTPRTIDLDILFYNNEVISTEKVKVPHPLLHERKFVLEPLMEIAPDLIHPILKKNSSQLLKECKDTYAVAKVMSK
jgi:2-amino-4-hydroxy-6-hydroxymethyldihydropteridine diphosphokinase